ncbi:MAG: hypothetical protein EOO05_03520 [Chitinophagaceae bacterium]|nr:MAG: hypothetical protein EOO05_03520 [Chitinophagaceae bacterium]
MKLFRIAREAVRGHHGYAGVQDILWGSAFKDGVATGHSAIRFNVSIKKARSKLRSSDLIPRLIGGIKTDVTDFRFADQVRHELPYSLVRPLLGGVQVQLSALRGPLQWGTMGCELVFNGVHYGICNEHVLNASQPDTVLQPRRELFGEAIGRVSAIGDPRLDYRLVELMEQADPLQSFNHLPGIADGYMMPSGMNVLRLIKTGAASGLTAGIYDGRSLLEPWRITIRAGKDIPLSSAGDSGSMWVADGTQGGVFRMFALHTGGDEQGQMAMATLYASIHASVQRQLSMGKR